MIKRLCKLNNWLSLVKDLAQSASVREQVCNGQLWARAALKHLRSYRGSGSEEAHKKFQKCARVLIRPDLVIKIWSSKLKGK